MIGLLLALPQTTGDAPFGRRQGLGVALADAASGGGKKVHGLDMGCACAFAQLQNPRHWPSPQHGARYCSLGYWYGSVVNGKLWKRGVSGCQGGCVKKSMRGKDICVDSGFLPRRDCANDEAYLGGTGGSAHICDMFGPYSHTATGSAPYASGRWVRNCAAAAKARRRAPAAFNAFQFAGYNATVTGVFGTVPNSVWDTGGRSALCFGPGAAPLLKTQQLDTLFWNWRPKTCSLRPLDRKQFGQLLRNEKVVFVGDSLVNQLASSTWSLTGFKAPLSVVWLLVNPRTLEPMEHGEWLRCHSYAACTSSNASREQCLSQAGIPSEGDAATCPPSGGDAADDASLGPIDWTHALPQAGVLVLNTGAHLNSLLLPGVREHIRGVPIRIGGVERSATSCTSCESWPATSRNISTPGSAVYSCGS
jgi:hypothetical protein